MAAGASYGAMGAAPPPGLSGNTTPPNQPTHYSMSTPAARTPPNLLGQSPKAKRPAHRVFPAPVQLGPVMSLQDACQFIYTLNAKFEHLGNYLEGMQAAVIDHANLIESTALITRGLGANLGNTRSEIAMMKREAP